MSEPEETERSWEVQFTLKTNVFGTSPQVMASIERWKDLLEVQLQREVELTETRLEAVDRYQYELELIKSRGYFALCCRECNRATGRPLPIPFKTVIERQEWTTAHTEETGHQEFHHVDLV